MGKQILVAGKDDSENLRCEIYVQKERNEVIADPLLFRHTLEAGLKRVNTLYLWEMRAVKASELEAKAGGRGLR